MVPIRNLVFLLTVASLGWAKEKAAPKKSTEEPKKCPACEDCSAATNEVKKLQEKIKALEEQLSATKADAKQGGDSTPYASFQILKRSVSTVSDFVNDGLESTKMQMPELSVGEVGSTAWNTANQSFIAIKTFISQAAPMVSSTAALAQSKAGEASLMASDIYTTHLKAHVGEYITVAVDAYGKHLSPHMAKASKMYDEHVQPAIDAGSKIVKGRFGSIIEKGMAFSQDINMAEGLGGAITKVKAHSKEPLDAVWKKMSFICEPKELKILNKTFSFPYGYIDMALAAMQAFVAGFIVSYLAWKLVLKTIVWKILLKFFGRKLLVGTTTAILKLCYKTTRLTQKITWFLIALLFKAVFFSLRLVIACCMGLGFIIGAEKGAQAGLQKSAKDFGITLEMRLAASLFLGMLFFCCCCCSKRKKVDKSKANIANGHAKGAANGAATNGKQAPKAQPKKVGKK